MVHQKMQHCSYGVLTPELFNLACRNRDAHLPSQMQYAVNLLRWLRNLKKQNGMLPTRKEGCHWMLNFSECHEHLHYCCSHSAVNSVDVSEASWSDPKQLSKVKLIHHRTQLWNQVWVVVLGHTTLNVPGLEIRSDPLIPKVGFLFRHGCAC